MARRVSKVDLAALRAISGGRWGGVPGVQCWAALGTGPLAGIMEWYRACVINEVFGLNAGCLEKEMPPKGTALKCE